jgi:hypothetical protein
MSLQSEEIEDFLDRITRWGKGFLELLGFGLF